MEFAFPWPVTDGEWLGFGSAAVTVLIGLIHLFFPWVGLRLTRLRTAENHPEALAAIRANMAGFLLGLGLCCILLAQPLLYVALGFCWLFTVFGRLISMLSDRGGTLLNWVWIAVELVLAAMPLAFSLGFVP